MGPLPDIFFFTQGNVQECFPLNFCSRQYETIFIRIAPLRRAIPNQHSRNCAIRSPLEEVMREPWKLAFEEELNES